ncbi:MAG: transporter substrate-binding domain-containing protein [Clostridiales bacterium]|nr:transporter substrate-binding domain-containing protein [Clostridiales bacterium]
MSLKMTGIVILAIGIVLLSFTGCTNQISENELINADGTEMGEIKSNVKTVRIVSSTWAPYEYEENGVAKGIGVDVTVEALNRMGYEATVTFVPFKRAIEMIQSGEADILTDVNKTKEREEYGIFHEDPILMSRTCLFVKADSAIDFDGDLFKLSEYTFGINRGYSHGEEFNDAFANNLLIVEEAEDIPQNLKKLLNDRIDILLDNELVVLMNMKNLGYQDQIKVLKPEYRNAPLYNMFSKKNDLYEMAEMFNEKVLEIKEDGTFQKIYNSYIK